MSALDHFLTRFLLKIVFLLGTAFVATPVRADLTWALEADDALRYSADNSILLSLIERGETEYERRIGRLTRFDETTSGRITPETVAACQAQMLCDLLARWVTLRGGNPAPWEERAASWRDRLASQLGEGGKVRLNPAEGFDTAFWPVVTGAVEREVVFAVVDQWMAWRSVGGGDALMPTDLAYWAARGCALYGRRDGAVGVLEAVEDVRGMNDVERELWTRLTGGQRGRPLPPDTPFPGHPPRVPYWAFRPWVWEDDGNTAESTLNLVQGYMDRDIPVGAVIVDSPWSTAYNDFNWDRERYPDPAAMVDALHADGVKVVMWLTGSINRTSKDTPLQKDPAFEEVAAKGYAVDHGRVVSWWKGEGRLIDFTHPEAVAWWIRRFDQVAALGIDGWKVDVSDDYVPAEVDTFLGKMPREKWRQYYYATVRDVAWSRNPASAILARPYSHQGGFAAPVSKATIGWAGDFPGDWHGMRWQVYDLYTSARAGYATLYYEVGGYQDPVPDKAQLVRHAQLGAFFPVMSNGGANGGLTGHLPWYHDDETVAIYRRFAQWHNALAPYFFGLAIESNLTGRPLLRDIDMDHWLHQLGEDLLVAPVFASDTSREIPATEDRIWFDLWSGQPLSANESTTVDVPLEDYPVFVRQGAIVPLDLREGLHDWNLPKGQHGFALWIVPGEVRRVLVHFPAGEGTDALSAMIRMDAAAREIRVEGELLPSLSLVVSRSGPPFQVEGALDWHYDAVGRRLFVSLPAGGGRIVVREE